MKRTLLSVMCLLAGAFGASAQMTDQQLIDRALAAAPRNMKEAATVVKFKADGTYETLKKGTNKLFCYDRSNEVGRPAFAVQCTSLANMDRVVQNRKFEQIADKDARAKAINDAEANGTRVKPEFGSVWLSMSGPDAEHARVHTTVAVPGATAQTMGLPDNPSKGGIWIMGAGTSTAHLMTPGS